jgi:hypothetical protein
METLNIETVANYNLRNSGSGLEIVAGWLPPEDFDPMYRLWCADCMEIQDTNYIEPIFKSDPNLDLDCDRCQGWIE